jgi:hypothetical protein
MGSLRWRRWPIFPHRILQFADCLLRRSRSIGLMPRRILSQTAHEVNHYNSGRLLILITTAELLEAKEARQRDRELPI